MRRTRSPTLSVWHGSAAVSRSHLGRLEEDVVLRRAGVSSRDPRLHDPGRRCHRPGQRRQHRLQHPRRDQRPHSFGQGRHDGDGQPRTQHRRLAVLFITEGPTRLSTTGDAPVGTIEIFGQCKVALVKSIARVPRDGMDRPMQEVRIKRVTIERRKASSAAGVTAAVPRGPEAEGGRAGQKPPAKPAN